jgi:hypothetical protein
MFELCVCEQMVYLRRKTCDCEHAPQTLDVTGRLAMNDLNRLFFLPYCNRNCNVGTKFSKNLCNIKFHRNWFNGSRAVTYGQTW